MGEREEWGRKGGILSDATAEKRNIIVAIILCSFFQLGCTSPRPTTWHTVECVSVMRPVVSFPVLDDWHETPKTIYNNPLLAVNIKSISTKGHIIEGKPIAICFDELDTSTSENPRMNLVYQFPYTVLDKGNTIRFTVLSRMDKDENEFKEFMIPVEATDIVITYTCRTPAGTESGDLVLNISNFHVAEFLKVRLNTPDLPDSQ